MPLVPERLREIVTELASRPRHEKVRALVYQLLVDGLGASSTEVDFERPVPEVHGRIDALLGRTVFEFKSDLRREKGDAERKLPDYLAQRETETGQHFVGIATDGATFLPYELRDRRLRQLPAFTTSLDRPRELLAWRWCPAVTRRKSWKTPKAASWFHRTTLSKSNERYGNCTRSVVPRSGQPGH